MRATPIPEDFAITDQMRLWAAETMPQVNIDKEHEKFVDYFLATGKTMADWKACWRGWIRRCVNFKDACLYTNDELRIKKLMADYTAKGFRRAYTHENSMQYQAAFESQALAKLPQRDMSNILQLAGSKRL